MENMDGRRSHRLNIELPALLKVHPSKQDISSITVNVSAVGICLACEATPRIGSKFPIEITLPTKEKVVIQTEVVWVREAPTVYKNFEYHVGLKIIDTIDPPVEKFIRFYVEKFLKAFP